MSRTIRQEKPLRRLATKQRHNRRLDRYRKAFHLVDAKDAKSTDAKN